MNKKKILRFFLDLLETLAISLAIFLVVYIFFIQPHRVDGLSMYPNLKDGEYLLSDKMSYRFNEPQRGDVVIFHAPRAACYTFSECDFIKRIIGLPGETVELRDGVFYINGEGLMEPYISEGVRTMANGINDALAPGKVIVLADDEYIVVGDNREDSSDSRSWGQIRRDDILGKAFFSYWPPETIGVIGRAGI